uniref:protein-tyrosine-phosphatase n=1 Tax=Chromera velia CCMP2878 TaxID=1169474 RepID=A0A0G4I2W0_9ALVE|eukprot:Cvel_10515.t1-p1 / transcript=Cvel_10515.t1 / gene=Cvel_10515 / organism=Chromera_velia_CCMP2878 / gene_product=hypothetical protein / transcript_product=hypothetical protein / location=Cvel_scaffold636:22541-26756(-) / protein_length=1289 / sequence_SO=supercontig / SO=protein_coding / is_pseudo=false
MTETLQKTDGGLLYVIWDLDETLITFQALLGDEAKDKFAVQTQGELQAAREMALTLSEAILAVSSEYCFFHELEGLEPSSLEDSNESNRERVLGPSFFLSGQKPTRRECASHLQSMLTTIAQVYRSFPCREELPLFHACPRSAMPVRFKLMEGPMGAAVMTDVSHNKYRKGQAGRRKQVSMPGHTPAAHLVSLAKTDPSAACKTHPVGGRVHSPAPTEDRFSAEPPPSAEEGNELEKEKAPKEGGEKAKRHREGGRPPLHLPPNCLGTPLHQPQPPLSSHAQPPLPIPGTDPVVASTAAVLVGDPVSVPCNSPDPQGLHAKIKTGIPPSSLARGSLPAAPLLEEDKEGLEGGGHENGGRGHSLPVPLSVYSAGRRPAVETEGHTDACASAGAAAPGPRLGRRETGVGDEAGDDDEIVLDLPTNSRRLLSHPPGRQGREPPEQQQQQPSSSFLQQSQTTAASGHEETAGGVGPREASGGGVSDPPPPPQASPPSVFTSSSASPLAESGGCMPMGCEEGGENGFVELGKEEEEEGRGMHVGNGNGEVGATEEMRGRSMHHKGVVTYDDDGISGQPLPLSALGGRRGRERGGRDSIEVRSSGTVGLEEVEEDGDVCLVPLSVHRGPRRGRSVGAGCFAPSQEDRFSSPSMPLEPRESGGSLRSVEGLQERRGCVGRGGSLDASRDWMGVKGVGGRGVSGSGDGFSRPSTVGNRFSVPESEASPAHRVEGGERGVCRERSDGFSRVSTSFPPAAAEGGAVSTGNGEGGLAVVGVPAEPRGLCSTRKIAPVGPRVSSPNVAPTPALLGGFGGVGVTGGGVTSPVLPGGNDLGVETATDAGKENRKGEIGEEGGNESIREVLDSLIAERQGRMRKVLHQQQQKNVHGRVAAHQQEEEEEEETVNVDRLIRRMDTLSGGWRSTSFKVLQRLASLPSVRTRHFLVSAGQLIPTLVKLCLFRLSDSFDSFDVFSSSKIGKLGCFVKILEKIRADVGVQLEERRQASCGIAPSQASGGSAEEGEGTASTEAETSGDLGDSGGGRVRSRERGERDTAAAGQAGHVQHLQGDGDSVEESRSPPMKVQRCGGGHEEEEQGGGCGCAETGKEGVGQSSAAGAAGPEGPSSSSSSRFCMGEETEERTPPPELSHPPNGKGGVIEEEIHHHAAAAAEQKEISSLPSQEHQQQNGCGGEKQLKKKDPPTQYPPMAPPDASSSSSSSASPSVESPPWDVPVQVWVIGDGPEEKWAAGELGLPFFCVRGRHDLPGVEATLLAGFEEYRRTAAVNAAAREAANRGNKNE